MKVISPGLNNGIIPIQHTGFGIDISPELIVDAIPEGTISIAVVFDDLDVPLMKEFTHWIIWNIPVCSVIPKGIPKGKTINSPIYAVQGKAWGKHGYRGPKQPPFIHKAHRYRFTVYALNTMLELSADSNKKQLSKAMAGHIIESAELICSYKPER